MYNETVINIIETTLDLSSLYNAEDLDSELDVEVDKVTMETLEDCGTLRPPTPTGSVSDSDASDLQLRGGVLSPPAAPEEVERPHTPGRGLDVVEAAGELLFPPPATPLPLPPPPPPLKEQAC